MKILFKDSVIHIQYWYLKQVWRAIQRGESISKIHRYYRDYMKSNMDYSKSPLVLGLPWITFEAIDFLKDIVEPEMKVFEFGSGGSTKFFAERVLEVHSVDHHEGWYQKVKTELGQYSNLHLYWKKQVEPTKNSRVKVEDESEDGFDYENYTEVITRFEDLYFDLILVDGKARNTCVRKSLGKLKSGGYMIVDNSNRKAYTDSLDKLGKWLVFRSFGPSLGSKVFTQTSFYKKP